LEAQRIGYDFKPQRIIGDRTSPGPFLISIGKTELASYPHSIGQYNSSLQYQPQSSGPITLPGPSSFTEQSRENESNINSSSYTGSGEYNNGFPESSGTQRRLPNQETSNFGGVKEIEIPTGCRSLRKEK
jgi:hypothetical protein